MTREEKKEQSDKIFLEWEALKRAGHKSPRQVLAIKYNLAEVTVWRKYKEAMKRNSKLKAL